MCYSDTKGKRKLQREKKDRELRQQHKCKLWGKI